MTMMTARLWRSIALTSMLSCTTLAMTGCEKPPVGQAGQPVAAGGMEFSVGEYDVRYLQLSQGGETFEYPRPVLVIPVTITNKGQDAHPYSPTHEAAQMTEASTPLLYADPGPEAKLPPESKTPIAGAIIKKGQLAGQLTEPTSIAAGASVTDLLLFQVPPKELTGLVLSLPRRCIAARCPCWCASPIRPRPPLGLRSMRRASR